MRIGNDCWMKKSKPCLTHRKCSGHEVQRVAKCEQTYGPLMTGDLFLKLAEYKNFETAKALCDGWDEETIWVMGNYLGGEMGFITPITDRDEAVALLFLRDCINNWQHQTQQNRGTGVNRSGAVAGVARVRFRFFLVPFDIVLY